MEPEVQNPYLEEALQKGVAFEQLLTVPGWDLIRAYIENATKSFANRVVNEDMDEKTFLIEKGKIKGLLALLAEIDTALTALANERNKTKQPTEPTL